MSELRWDPLKRHRVIIAADRGRRPNDFLATEPPTPMTSCPFCYGNEDKVWATISALPENPRDRNFWHLLARREVPKETYDYLLSIASAAVICENPRFFGMDAECPVLGTQRTSSGSEN